MSEMSSPSSSPTRVIDVFSDDETWPELEFCSPEDEAWYGVDVWEMCDSLVVTFNGFSCAYDEVYSPEDFKNMEELKTFEDRFRACSVQMQDTECPIVNEGKRVCATCPSVTGEVKFYDAVVVGVDKEKHGRDEEGNEVCGCSFRLFWKHGPYVEQVTSAKVGDICLKQEEDNRMNPIVIGFLKEARRQIIGEAHQGGKTEWQKILEKVSTAVRNYNLNSSV